MASPSRLAELVSLLTGCELTGALRAVTDGQRQHLECGELPGDPLALVARAMVTVHHPSPPGFRVAGYLRTDLPLAVELRARCEWRPSRLPQRHPQPRLHARD
jgi:hypothetical protein